MIGALLPTAAVFGAAMLGGLTRWALTRILWPKVGLLLANLLACAVLAWAIVHLSGLVETAIGVGFAGACSTLSTVANQVAEDVEKRKTPAALLYLGATVGLSELIVILLSR
ncbi:CrcB family protein [Corynebacterium tapiri]|uniref:Fluoride-specific ion channel n=1 Tax=Corynebacterium tapiri TaxID=1448266 RepID=A0A5C4U2L6_9CORY|nr:CrcB family protein [Corynebacterium tapiri]TNL95619.1 CrcB family protein [Corynebacterium tapiri]